MNRASASGWAVALVILPGFGLVQGSGRSYYEVASATAHELPTLGGVESVANDVNNSGQIVGWSVNTEGVQNAFLIQPHGTIQNIGTAVSDEVSSAESINEHAEIVGYFVRSRHRPFYWHASSGFTKMSVNLLPDEPYGDEYDLRPYAINDHGMIVGRGHHLELGAPPVFCLRNAPVYWTSPTADPKILLCRGEWWGHTAATDVSNSGWIAHFHEVANYDRGYRYAYPFGTYLVPDLASGLNSLHMWGINESGVVVGDAETDSQSTLEYTKVAYYWNGTSQHPKTIAPFAGGDKAAAFDVNEQNFVVGYGEKEIVALGDPTMGERAFLWHEEFGRYELPTPTGWQAIVANCRAHALNDLYTGTRGNMHLRVVGYCQKKNGPRQAVRWAVTIGTTSIPPISFSN
jgi:probable HAF family extracellular repeat protein